jgi:TusA-related sulfurtransferase
LSFAYFENQKSADHDAKRSNHSCVVSTDPGSLRDFAAFAKQTGNELLSQETQGTDFIHVLKRR